MEDKINSIKADLIEIKLSLSQLLLRREVPGWIALAFIVSMCGNKQPNDYSKETIARACAIAIQREQTPLVPILEATGTALAGEVNNLKSQLAQIIIATPGPAEVYGPINPK